MGNTDRPRRCSESAGHISKDAFQPYELSPHGFLRNPKKVLDRFGQILAAVAGVLHIIVA